jgi:hypothetical protein
MHVPVPIRSRESPAVGKTACDLCRRRVSVILINSVNCRSVVYLCTEHEMMWIPPGETIPGRERQTVHSPKLILTVVWNPSKFHVMKSLPERTKLKAQYSVNKILIGISDWRLGAGETRPKKIEVHADNARPPDVKVEINFPALNGIKSPSSTLFARLGTLGLLSFRLCEKKSDGISCRQFVRASGSHSSYCKGHPG